MRTSLLLTVVAALSLAFTVRAAEQPGESVNMSSLPDAVQKTIKDKSAGGEVTGVKREDDKNGRWNYEVTVKSNGKEWGFEVDPNGKMLKKHEGKK